MWKYCVIRVNGPVLIGMPGDPIKKFHAYGLSEHKFEIVYSAPEQSEAFSMGEGIVINGMDACEAWLEENAHPSSTYIIQKLWFYEKV